MPRSGNFHLGDISLKPVEEQPVFKVKRQVSQEFGMNENIILTKTKFSSIDQNHTFPVLPLPSKI